MIHIKNFSNNTLYENLNLNIKQGTVCALIGDNGTGKSLLTKYLIGLYNNYEGEIYVCDQKLLDDNYQLIQQDIGLIMQNPYNQFCGETVLDEIIFHLQMHPSIDIEKHIDNLDVQFLNTKLVDLSYGNAVNLLINNFITTNKKVIICDEVITALDLEMKQAIFELVRQKNITLLYITNNQDDCKYADITYELADKTLKEYKYLNNEINLLDNCNDYFDKPYKYGINIIEGAVSSGKTTILKKLYQEYDNSFLITQTPMLQINYDMVDAYLGQFSNDYEKYFDEFDLDVNLMNKSMFELSTGQLITVMIIGYLTSDCKILLIDEGFEVMSQLIRNKVLDLIEKEKLQIIATTKNIEIYNNRYVNLIKL